MALAARTEDAGGEIFVLAGGGRDVFGVLGACAIRTRRLRLGACLPPGERPPGLFAKGLATLDVLSGGRAFGLLAAEPTEDADALERLFEQLEVIRLLLRVPAPDYSGVHHRLRAAWNEPRRRSAPPVGLVLPADASSETEAALLALAARSADLVVTAPQSGAAGHGLGLAAALTAATAAAGRLPGAVRLLTQVTVSAADDDPELRRVADGCLVALGTGALPDTEALAGALDAAAEAPPARAAAPHTSPSASRRAP